MYVYYQLRDRAQSLQAESPRLNPQSKFQAEMMGETTAHTAGDAETMDSRCLAEYVVLIKMDDGV